MHRAKLFQIYLKTGNRLTVLLDPLLIRTRRAHGKLPSTRSAISIHWCRDRNLCMRILPIPRCTMPEHLPLVDCVNIRLIVILIWGTLCPRLLLMRSHLRACQLPVRYTE